MKTSQAAIDLIKQAEGFSAEAYLCPAGKWTIGYGHMLADYEKMTLSKAQAEALLALDLERCEAAILRLVRVTLSQNQFDALASFIYNVGIGAFSRSIMLKKLNKSDFAGAAVEFDRWIYANKTPLEGLKRRRAREKTLFLNE